MTPQKKNRQEITASLADAKEISMGDLAKVFEFGGLPAELQLGGEFSYFSEPPSAL